MIVHWILRVACLIVAIATISFGAQTQLVAQYEEDPPEGGIKCTTMCKDAGDAGCNAGYHKTRDATTGETNNGIVKHTVDPNDCWGPNMTCDYYHGGCTAPDPDLIDAVASAVNKGDVIELRRMIGTKRGSVVVNRNSIQVRSCAGTVIANLPAGSKVINSLIASH